MTTLLGAAVFSFWMWAYPQALNYHEQNQLFLCTWEYFRERLALPGGFADWLSEFLVQFFFLRWSGALVLAILAVLLLSVAYAIYRGAVQTVLNTGALILAVLLAYPLSVPLSDAVAGNTAITSQLLTYTDALARVGDVELANTPVTGISPETIDLVVENTGLPDALATILRRNLESGARIESDRTVNDYVQSAVLASAIRILSYLICALGVYIGLSLLIALFNSVFHFPLVRGVDAAAAGLFGLARGAMLLALLFLLVPLALTAVPLTQVRETLAASRWAGHFMKISFFTGIYFH